MEIVEDLDQEKSIIPFNSSLESGVRSVIILNACYPSGYDLSQLTWLDHLVAHSSDIGGPLSLHPDVPQRSGEILVRRRIVESGLNLMRRLHMIEVVHGNQGVQYMASDEAAPFVELMSTKYHSMLKERATWLASGIGKLDYEEMRALIVNRLGKWSIEFDGNQIIEAKHEI